MRERHLCEFPSDARFIVPACRKHHAEAHRIGIESFADRHFLFLDEEAARIEAMWQALQAIGALHTTDPLCARCRASFREDDSAFCGSCAELNRQERPAKARKRQSPRDAA